MAIRGFTGTDENRGKKKVAAPNKIKGQEIGRPSTRFAAPWTATRWGDTLGSVRSTATPVNPQDVAVTPPIQNASGGMPGVANTDWRTVATSGPQALTQSGPSSRYATSMDTGVGGPLTGFGADAGYTRQGLAQLYQNPLPLAQDVLDSRGVDNYGMAQLLADYFNPLLLQEMALSQGLGDRSDDVIIDWIARAMQEATTPGGRAPEFADIMDSLLGATDPTQSLLAADLNALSPEKQVETMLMYLQAAGYGNNPLAQRAYNRAADYFGNEYLASTMKGNPSARSYAEFLANSPLKQWYRR